MISIWDSSAVGEEERREREGVWGCGREIWGTIIWDSSAVGEKEEGKKMEFGGCGEEIWGTKEMISIFFNFI